MARFWFYLRSMRWPAVTALILAIVTLLSLPVFLVLRNSVTPVQFEEPRMSVALEFAAPAEVSQHWLLDVVKEVMRKRLGKIYVIGDIGADPVTTIYSKLAEPQWPTVPEEVISTHLQCSARLCLLDISRQRDGRRHSAQAMLSADMPLQRWREVVKDTTRNLYR